MYVRDSGDRIQLNCEYEKIMYAGSIVLSSDRLKLIVTSFNLCLLLSGLSLHFSGAMYT